MVKTLRKAGWSPTAAFVGSHRKWSSADGSVTMSIPEGHSNISPGVVRQILAAIERSKQ
ncbi:type II toxin-antitoxin system HicA family toxin [Subtercola boreus]